MLLTIITHGSMDLIKKVKKVLLWNLKKNKKKFPNYSSEYSTSANMPQITSS